MIEDATWVFSMQQIDICATRNRPGWAPPAGPGLLLHEATLG